MLSGENPQTDDINEIEILIKNLERIIMGHKEIARIQRDSYNFQRKNKELLKSNILIEVLYFIYFICLMCFINILRKMDYKQKISIGLSPNQINKYNN